jgi:anti-sigma B factor antagonist
MPEAPTDMIVRNMGAITVVEFLDRRLIDAAQIERLGEQIQDLVRAAAVPKLVLNFEKVEYLSSSALNVLIALENAINKKKGQMRLASLDKELQKVFALMKLNKVMVLCNSLDDAIKSIK